MGWASALTTGEGALWAQFLQSDLLMPAPDPVDLAMVDFGGDAHDSSMDPEVRPVELGPL